MFEDENTLDVKKELSRIVLAALTSEDDLEYASINLLSKFTIENDKKASITDIAREAQSLFIDYDSLTEESAVVKVVSLLKNIKDILKNENKSESTADRIESLSLGE